VRVTADALQIEPVIVAPALAVPILLLLLIILLVTTRKKKQKRER
jgi:sortase A